MYLNNYYRDDLEALNSLRCCLIFFFFLLKSELDVPFKVKAGQIGKYFTLHLSYSSSF